jgi:dihydroflavonol-4-reductase
MNALVTGGAGRIGNVLVRELIKKGFNVSVIDLPNSNLESLKGLKVNIIKGSILDYNLLVNSFKKMDYVYHLAAIISIVPYDKKEVFETNVKGTINVINACIQCKVKRLIYTSTVHALNEKKKKIIDETVGFNEKTNRGNYDKSKAKASLEILKYVKNKNLDAIIICPTGVIGPCEYKLSFFGTFIKEYASKKMLFYINGAYDFVDVYDVCNGIIELGKKAKKGETFILSGRKTNVTEFNEILRKETGINPPMKMPFFIAYIFSYFMEIYYRISKKTPVITRYSLSTLRSNSYFSHEKATKIISYHPVDSKESFLNQVRWMKKNKMINY